MPGTFVFKIIGCTLYTKWGIPVNYFKADRFIFFIIFKLEGSWHDLARTSFAFKENTWRNGFTNVKFDRYLGQIQFDSIGYNRLA